MTYDPEADALYIALSGTSPYEGEDAGPLTLHLSKDGKIVGIELLSASKFLAPGAWSKAPLPGAEEAEVHAAE
jgi:uncharacterized protein YuzE